MKPCFRFGQPVGTALVIVGFVETIYSLFWLLLDLVSLEHTSRFNFFNGSADFEFFGHLQWHFWLALHFLMSCIFWVAVVFEGRKYFLYIWLILSFVHNAIFATIIITQNILHPKQHGQSSHSILLGCSLASFCLWRLYTMSVACQGLRRLKHKYNLRSDSVSDIDICLEPLGSGFCQTWEFFKDLPGVGAVTLITVELLWNIVNLCTRPLVMQMFGLYVLQVPVHFFEEIADFLLLEETFIRLARIFLDGICIYLLSKERLAAVRLWVIFYFLVFVASNTITGLMITHWWMDAPGLNVMIYHIFVLLSDLIFRTFVLYFIVKYAMVHVRNIAKL